MRSSQVRQIILKNIITRRIRKCFREIFSSAYEEEIDRLHNLMELYQEKRIHSLGGLTPSQFRRDKELHELYNNLYHSFQKSILCCSSGAFCISYRDMLEKGNIKPSNRPLEHDMVWIPHNSSWCCVKCYETYWEIKKCENCGVLNEKFSEIVECFFCNWYICDLCKNTCPRCGESYCNQCFYEHNKYCYLEGIE